MLINFDNIYKKYNLQITGVIHIGAHYGEEISYYLHHNINNIILFEPLRENFNVLKNNIKNTNIIAHNVALGSQEMTTTMILSSNNSQSSSILKPKEHLKQHPDVKFSGKEEVQVKTLDSYNLKNFNFINMDVQGYELEVLKGACETLKSIDYVYCEVNRAEVYENNAMVNEIDEFLSGYNFNRVETFWPTTKHLWGDAFYIK